MNKFTLPFAILATVVMMGGCGSSEGDQQTSVAESSGGKPARSPNAASPSFKPLSISSSRQQVDSTTESTADVRADLVRNKLKPFQIWVGQWRGITQKKIGQFNAIEEATWKWDFSEQAQPALEMTTDTGAYLQRGRLTWLADKQTYQFTAVDRQGVEHVYEGDFAEPPRDEPGTGDSLQRTFKLELTRVSSGENTKLDRLVFNQQDNNRYLLEIYEIAGDAPRRFDTIGTQREGTSFALSEDYGEKTCIISGGLGTTAVQYQGKTYWVCCSGCEAAFRENPEMWIAKAAQNRNQTAAQNR